MSGGNFDIGQNFNELLCTTGRINRRQGNDLDAAAVLIDGGSHCGQRFRLVVLNCNDHFARLAQGTQNRHAAHHVIGAFAHEHGIATDIGLAFRAVNDQGIDCRIAIGGQLRRAREYRTT